MKQVDTSLNNPRRNLTETGSGEEEAIACGLALLLVSNIL
jgi:hypothetical protein